jgi:hypothetical protein
MYEMATGRLPFAAKRASDRYPNAAELSAALIALASHHHSLRERLRRLFHST